jgi:PilZ domain
MNSRERRYDTRVNIRVPFRFRVLNSPDAPEQDAESENISQRGILFATALPLQVGTPLEVSLKMPQELAGKSANDVKCVARVVHVQPNAFVGGKAGVGVHIEGYEAVAAAGAGARKDRWMS